MQRLIDALPDFLTFHRQVLASECDVVTGPRQHDLCFRILHDQADGATHLFGASPVNSERAVRFTLVVAPEHAGNTAQQC